MTDGSNRENIVIEGWVAWVTFTSIITHSCHANDMLLVQVSDALFSLFIFNKRKTERHVHNTDFFISYFLCVTYFTLS